MQLLAAERGFMPSTMFAQRTTRHDHLRARNQQEWFTMDHEENHKRALENVDTWKAERVQIKINMIVDYLLWLDSGVMPEREGWRNERLAKAARAYLAEHLTLEDDWTEVVLDFLEDNESDNGYLLHSFRAENAQAMVVVEQAERKSDIFHRCPNMRQGRLIPLKNTGVDDIEEIRRWHMLRVLNGFESAQEFVSGLDVTSFHDYLWNGNRLPWWTTVWKALDQAGEAEAAAVARQDPLVRLMYLRQ